MLSKYGEKETNPINSEMQKKFLQPESLRTVDWTDPDLARIVRLRLISDPGFPMWDISYCWGITKFGHPVNVDLPFPYGQLPKGQGAIQKAIIAAAKRDKVYAKGLGIFDAISTLI